MNKEIDEVVSGLFLARRNLHSGIGYRRVMEEAEKTLARMCYDAEGLEYWTETAHVSVFLSGGVTPTIDVTIDGSDALTIEGDICKAEYEVLEDRWKDLGPILRALAEVCA